MQNLEKIEIENLCNDDVQDIIEAPTESKKSLWSRAQAGATAIEYALIASLIGVAIIGSLGFLAADIETTFNNVAGNLN